MRQREANSQNTIGGVGSSGNSANNNRPQTTSFESERSVLLQATSVGNSWLSLSVQVLNTEQNFFHKNSRAHVSYQKKSVNLKESTRSPVWCNS